MTEQEHVVSLLRNTDSVVRQQQLGEATSQIQYISQGHALVIGRIDKALEVATPFKTHGFTIVEINPALDQMKKRLTEEGVAVFSVPALSVEGYLGAFKATVPGIDKQGSDFDLGVSVYLQSGCFDVVLDLSDEPVLSQYLSPFGYRHCRADEQINDAIDELLDMKGEFEKPRYFNYDATICAHSRSNLPGCNRCKDACAAGAILSAGEGISVDPFLCQGCGSCATVCPSGAISYAYPRPSNAIDRTRASLDHSNTCVLLLHTEESDELVNASALHTDILALQVEEISAFGADYWLSMLASRARRILLLSDAPEDDPSRQAIIGQIDLVNELLQGLGIDEFPIRLIPSESLSDADSELAGLLQPHSWHESMLGTSKVADFATHNDKRQTLRLALDALSDQLPPLNEVLPLHKGAPFGRINVDTKACTLCMACVSICPAKALQDGQDTPALRLVEFNCLQCGLCETACPESAITLQPQYTWDSIKARQVRTLHEEAPFHCLVCHTPFTTRAMIETMSAKLAGHWMFEDPKALRRLKMCGDCRVRDMFESESGGIDVHKS